MKSPAIGLLWFWLLAACWAQSPKDQVDDWTTGTFLTYPPGAKVTLLDSSQQGSELGLSNQEISVPAGGKNAIFYYRIEHPDGQHKPLDKELPSGYFNAKQRVWPENGHEVSLTPNSLWVASTDLFRYPSWRTVIFGLGLIGLSVISWAAYQFRLTRNLKLLGSTMGVSPYQGYYRVRELKAGGHGQLYLAVPRNQVRASAIRALKVINLKGEPRDVRESRLRSFPREVETIQALDHPNIPKYYESGHIEDDQRDELYLVMEYVDGSDLSHYVPLDPKQTPKRVLEYLQGIASALQAMHSQGIIHRDLKPENVMLTKEGQIKLLDFGLSRPQNKTSQLSQAIGSMEGTRGYFCPEQFRGPNEDDSKMTVLSDQYSFGVLCSRLIAAHFPISPPEGEDPVPYVMSVRNGMTQPLESVRPELSKTSQVIEKMMSLNSKDRYDSISEAYQALEAALRSELKSAQ